MEKSPEQCLTQGDNLPLSVLQSQKFHLSNPLLSSLWIYLYMTYGNAGGTSSIQKKAQVPGKIWMVVHWDCEATARPTVPEAHIQSVHHIPITHGQDGIFLYM